MRIGGILCAIWAIRCRSNDSNCVAHFFINFFKIYLCQRVCDLSRLIWVYSRQNRRILFPPGLGSLDPCSKCSKEDEQCSSISTARWLFRHLSTEAAEKSSKNISSNSSLNESYRLYRRLSALGKTRGCMSQALDQYSREGNAINKYQLGFCIKELRKYRSLQYALQVYALPTVIKIVNLRFGFEI